MPTLLETAPSIVEATIEDFDDIKSMMACANCYAFERGGQEQWPNTEVVHGQIRHHIEWPGDEYWIVRGREGLILAGIGVAYSDERWDDERALYFHKFMKDPSRSVPGVAAALLGHVVAWAEAQSIERIRCDAQTSMPGLVRYYTNYYGFTVVGKSVYESLGNAEATLLEIPTATLAARCAEITMAASAELVA
jgi:RimJ/RimL family protein N-acetyltransferase